MTGAAFFRVEDVLLVFLLVGKDRCGVFLLLEVGCSAGGAFLAAAVAGADFRASELVTADFFWESSSSGSAAAASVDFFLAEFFFGLATGRNLPGRCFRFAFAVGRTIDTGSIVGAMVDTESEKRNAAFLTLAKKAEAQGLAVVVGGRNVKLMIACRNSNSLTAGRRTDLNA